jgi:hypothetical protein
MDTVINESDKKPYADSNSSPDNKRKLVLVPPIKRVHGLSPGGCDVLTRLSYQQILLVSNVR